MPDIMHATKASMCVSDTPFENHVKTFGLWVKREDLCCPTGPHFSKCRGVFAHIQKRPESIIGVLDTSHSQGGWAVAQACKLLNKHCVLYYPVRKADRELGMDWDPTGKGSWGDTLREPQLEAERLGASLIPLEAGRSAILYHRAKKLLWEETELGSSYFMPNALKLSESVTETAAEFCRTKLPDVPAIIVSASSATIAAGVWLGARKMNWPGEIVVHMGYSRPEAAVRSYIAKMVGLPVSCISNLIVSNEYYDYADEARPGPTPPFACNKYYDLKTFRWWVQHPFGRATRKRALMWNIG